MAAKKKKTTTKPYGNKTKFVLGLARDLSAKEVVDEAKKNGITITEAHVYKIRSTAKTKGKPATKATKGRRGAAKSAGRSAGGDGQSKREFVLSFGSDTPASEILRKAKEAGIGLSKAYLYTIRSSGGATQRRGTRALGEAKTALRRVRGAAASLESQFVEAALDLGFAKATELLNRLRTRAKSY
jgi:type III secretion system FlhB-like substrate exporter